MADGDALLLHIASQKQVSLDPRRRHGWRTHTRAQSGAWQRVQGQAHLARAFEEGRVGAALGCVWVNGR